MGVLAAMSPAELAQAVSLEDDGAFRRVSGIGPKTAKLIVVSLAGKLGMATTARAKAASAPVGARRRDDRAGRPRLAGAHRGAGGRGCAGIRHRHRTRDGAALLRASPSRRSARSRPRSRASGERIRGGSRGGRAPHDRIGGAGRRSRVALRPRTLAEFVGQQKVAGSCSCCCRRPRCSTARPTTSCSQAHRASGRRRSR